MTSFLFTIALRQLKQLSIGSFLTPGDSGFVLGGHVPAPGSRAEAGSDFHYNFTVDDLN